MAWIGNPDERVNPERDRLLAERADLVNKIEALKNSPLPANAPAYQQKFRRDDLMELASKIVKIDKKLGR